VGNESQSEAAWAYAKARSAARKSRQLFSVIADTRGGQGGQDYARHTLKKH